MKQRLLLSAMLCGYLCALLPYSSMAEPAKGSTPTLPDSIFSIEANGEITPKNFFFVKSGILPYNPMPRNDYSVSLRNGKGSLISPSWILTASHIISWNEQKYPETLQLHSPDLNGIQYSVAKVFRHPYKDLALIQLKAPVPDEREPALLMYDELYSKYGDILIREVAEGYPDNNLLAKNGGSDDLVDSNTSPTARPHNSGAAWIIESPLAGDVLTAISNGVGSAQQVAYAKHWIEQIVSVNTPDEMLYWVGIDKALPGYHPPALAAEEKAEPPASKPTKRTLVILP